MTVLRYAHYARKSSEARERQVLSIESQTEWAYDAARIRGVAICKTFNEEKSAETPFLRAEFDALVRDIRAGTLDAIVCWKLDRLARNPEEAGIVLGLLKRGELKHIITSDREYRPEDNAIISYVDFGMADQYVRDLSKNVKRGLYTKTQKGWRGGSAPVGYLNTKTADKGANYIIDDSERFELVQQLLRTFLDSNISVRQLERLASKWSIRTRQTKRQGGKKLVVSHIYRLLTNPFYAGHFWANNPMTGERLFVKGAHNAMITLEEFDRIQIKLGRKGQPRPHNATIAPYNGKIECGECGSMVTTDVKHQLICSSCKHKFAYRNADACPKCTTKITAMENPKIVEYAYHYCTKRKNLACSQKAIRSQELLNVIDKTLSRFKVSDGFAKWALEELAKENAEKVQSHKTVIQTQQQRYSDVVARLLNLTMLFTSPDNRDNSLLSLAEYAPQRKALLEEKNQLEAAQQDTGKKVEQWIDWAENSFDFAVAAQVWFENGTPEQRRDIFFSLSRSNIILKDRIVSIGLEKSLMLYGNIVSKYPSTTIAFELPKNGSIVEQNLPFGNDILALRRR